MMNALRTNSLPIAASIALIVGFSAALCVSADARASAGPAEDGAYLAVVTGDNVYVRSGASGSYYPFGRVNRGEMVKVVGDRFNFARVHTVGPAFPESEFFGYLIYPKTQPGRFRLAADGKSGTTLSRMDVLAPNLTTDFNPNDSWKPLTRLEAGEEVTILQHSETRNNVVLHIALPKTAEGWINMRYLRAATDEERAQWERALAGKDEEPREAKPQPREERAEQPQPTTERVERPSPPAEAEPDEPAEPQPLARDMPETIEPIVPEPVTEQPKAEREDERVSERELEQAQPHDDRLDQRAEAEEAQRFAERMERITIEDLEAAFEALREEPIETAEVTQLRDMYRELARRLAETDEAQVYFAEARAEQLQIWADAQERRAAIKELRTRAEMAGERTAAVRLAMEAAGDYTAVGRLTASTIYDGKRLPLLKRLRDPGTGRTVAYIEPDDRFDLDGMLGQLLGVVGERSYEGGLRLNVIRPRRIDLLAPQDFETLEAGAAGADERE